MNIINWPLLLNPFNWLIIALILMIASMGAMAVDSRFTETETEV